MGLIMNLPIQLISSCSTQGNFIPIRFRYEDEEHGIITVQIDELINSKENNFNGIREIIYTCRAEIHGTMRIFDLRYNVSSHRFSIYRLLD